MRRILDFSIGEDPDDEDEDTPERNEELAPAAALLRFLKTRTVLLSGPIDKTLADKVFRQLLMMEMDSADEPITIIVDSPGGDADAGLAIFDMIRFIKPPVKTLAAGLAASAAAIIMLAPPKNRRFSLPHARFLIHQPLSGVRGSATDVAIQAEAVRKLKDMLNELVSAETGQPLDRVRKDTDRDYWMDAEEAKAYGIISKVVSKRDELP